MFRRLTDFGKSWEYESEATLKLLRALDDASLGRAAEPGAGRSAPGVAPGALGGRDDAAGPAST